MNSIGLTFWPNPVESGGFLRLLGRNGAQGRGAESLVFQAFIGKLGHFLTTVFQGVSGFWPNLNSSVCSEEKE